MVLLYENLRWHQSHGSLDHCQIFVNFFMEEAHTHSWAFLRSLVGRIRTYLLSNRLWSIATFMGGPTLQFHILSLLFALNYKWVDAAASLRLIHLLPLFSLTERIFGKAAHLGVHHFLGAYECFTRFNGSRPFSRQVLGKVHLLGLLVLCCDIFMASLANLGVPLLVHGEYVGRLLDNLL